MGGVRAPVRGAAIKTESEPVREDDQATAGRPATFEPFRRLKQRAEFQRVSRGRRRSASAFTLQGARRDPARDPAVPAAGLGFTVTKKVGNAVVRNRIRRRLKAAVREAAPLEASRDHDYVVLARREALTQGFAALIGDLKVAFGALARDGRSPGKAKTHRPRDEASPSTTPGIRRERSEHEDRRP